MTWNETPVLSAIVVDALLNLFGWLASSYLKTDRYYDLLGASSHLLAVIAAYGTADVAGPRAQLAAVMVCLWAIRLGGFLFLRVLRVGHDARLDKFKNDPVAFALPWFMQSLWVLTNTSPLLVMLANGKDAPLTKVDVVPIALWAAGWIIEVIADEQKRQFAAHPNNRGQFIRTGLWALSRHPNYFGEILLWWSFSLLCAPAISWTLPQALVLLSPAFATLLLLRVSGVPMLESAAKRKWGEDPAYRAYVEGTSVLIPWVPARGVAPARGGRSY